jgi:hypothetical protein
MRPSNRNSRATTSAIRFAILVGLAVLSYRTAAGTACSDLDPVGVLPEDESCPGWTRDGDPAAAHTLEELQLVIDGGAPLFFEYGFEAGAFQDYFGSVGGTQTRLELSIYNQTTSENAQALFHDENSGSGDPVSDWSGSGEARCRVAFGIVSFQFWEKCCFVAIVVNSGGENAVPHARCIAEEIVQELTDATPVANRSFGELRIIFR